MDITRPQAKVGFKQLFLRDLTDEHLRMMLKLVEYGGDPREWINDVALDRLLLFDVAGRGILGLAPRPALLRIEFVSGRGLIPLRREIVAFIKEIAAGRKIEMWTRRPGMMRLVEGLGFEKE